VFYCLHPKTLASTGLIYCSSIKPRYKFPAFLYLSARIHNGYEKINSISINRWLSKAEDNYRSGKGAEVEIEAHVSTTGKSEVVKFYSDFCATG